MSAAVLEHFTLQIRSMSALWNATGQIRSWVRGRRILEKKKRKKKREESSAAGDEGNK